MARDRGGLIRDTPRDQASLQTWDFCSATPVKVNSQTFSNQPVIRAINNMYLTDKSYFCASKLSPVSFIDLKAPYFFIIKPNTSGLTVETCSGRFLYVLKSFKYVEKQFELTAQWYAKVDWIARFYCDSLWVVASLFIWFKAVFCFLSGRDEYQYLCLFH